MTSESGLWASTLSVSTFAFLDRTSSTITNVGYLNLDFVWRFRFDIFLNFTVDSLWALGRISFNVRALAAPPDVQLHLVLVLHDVDLYMVYALLLWKFAIDLWPIACLILVTLWT